MADIIVAVGLVVAAFVDWFAAISTALMTNTLVLLVIALGLIGYTASYFFRLLGKIKGGKKRRR